MARYKIARGNVRKLLLVINQIQDMSGQAWHYHQNDRDPNGFEKGQKLLEKINALCIETTGLYAPIQDTAAPDAARGDDA
jgi:hypothetical protein